MVKGDGAFSVMVKSMKRAFATSKMDSTQVMKDVPC